MMHLLRRGIFSRNGIIRKSSSFLLRGPLAAARWKAKPEDLQALPPVLANSFPKSGTHLLDQVVEALPGCRNYGRFLGSMTSSFKFRQRSPENVLAFIESFVPGEVIRGHLFYSEPAAAALAAKHTVHYFIFRDPRDVVLSETHYLRSLNTWHKLHPYFRDAPSMEEAISLSIKGLEGRVPGVDYRNIGERFQRYAGWVGNPDICAVRFEDLVSEDREAHLRRMLDFYRERTETHFDNEAVLAEMIESMRPEKSHTYRKGKSGGWREKFSEHNRELFKEIAGEKLIELGYEQDLDW